MADAVATRYVRFPPLAGLVGSRGAPAPVAALLTDRWMAEAASAGPGAFMLDWRASEEPCRHSGEPASPVRWHPEDDGGSLRNGAGRVIVSDDRRQARIELLAGAAERPGCLEPLLEAALGHALAAFGECFLHAAALELSGRTPLLLGASGSGKSTLAAAAAAHGGRVISDDSLLLGLADGLPLVRSARRSLWLRPGSDALVPALAAAGFETERCGDRRRLDRGSAPTAFRLATHPDCLVVLRRAPDVDPVARRRLSQAEMLAALLRSTSALYVTDPRFARGRLGDLLALFAERLPAIELAIGPALLESTEECLAAVVASLP